MHGRRGEAQLPTYVWAAVAAGVDVTTKVREFISYVDCLTGVHNGSWRTPGFHIFHLCFDPGCVLHCNPIVPASSSNFESWLVGPPPWALFEQDSNVSAVEVCEIFIFDVYSQITSAATEAPVNGTTEESRWQWAIAKSDGTSYASVNETLNRWQEQYETMPNHAPADTCLDLDMQLAAATPSPDIREDKPTLDEVQKIIRKEWSGCWT